MTVLAIHHVSLLVTDTARALKFYHELLGLPIAERPELGFPGAWLDVAGGQIHLLEIPEAITTRTRMARAPSRIMPP